MDNERKGSVRSRNNKEWLTVRALSILRAKSRVKNFVNVAVVLSSGGEIDQSLLRYFIYTK